MRPAPFVTQTQMVAQISQFATIMADPAWPYDNKDGPRAAPGHRPNSWDGVSGSVSSANRYGAMTIKNICDLPVASVVGGNAHLYLWTTNSFLVEAHQVARAWGFKPKTMITWGKMKADGTPSMKAGYYYRGATEHILFAVRGKLRLSGPPHPTLVLSRRLGHSEKPDWAYDMSMQQSPGPYLEMFARVGRLGWSSWGHQAPEGTKLLEGYGRATQPA